MRTRRVAVAGEVDRHRLLVLIARLRQRRQRLGQLVLKLRVIQRQVADRLQLDRPNRRACEQVQHGGTTIGSPLSDAARRTSTPRIVPLSFSACAWIVTRAPRS